MKLNRAELRKTLYDFNSISNRLMQANFQDYTDIVKKYVAYLKKTPIIYEYICDCGECDQNLQKEFSKIGSSYGKEIFFLGDEPEEEVRNVFSILNYIAENSIKIHFGVAWGYSTSNNYQDIVKGFNYRVVMVLIRHIETYLTKIGIDMGLDEKTNYIITVNNGQVNIANDNSVINADNVVGIDDAQLAELLKDVRGAASGLSEEDAETLASSLEVVETESMSEKPRKSFLKTAIASLKAIKGTVEFGAAVATLIQFLQPLL